MGRSGGALGQEGCDLAKSSEYSGEMGDGLLAGAGIIFGLYSQLSTDEECPKSLLNYRQ
jgi:hypothetical protein